ncbi:hypothetical protein CUU54_08800 [Pectobacterium polaris]|nr:hypothetical protein [Pectobacterium polaris]PWD59385.1 hypothetical protein DF209_11985 [Pectobacterium polaris]
MPYLVFIAMKNTLAFLLNLGELREGSEAEVKASTAISVSASKSASTSASLSTSKSASTSASVSTSVIPPHQHPLATSVITLINHT